MRIGQGFDVHRFKEGDHVMLGGVRVPHTKGVEAHSDGDVILHALCDALLGAAALGDIGVFFPPSDPKFAGMDSAIFLREVHARVQQEGYQIENLDITLVAEAPKVGPYRKEIRTKIANILNLNLNAVNIKATTTEKLGYCGREEGIAAYAVVLITQIVNRA
jgi:2-C-methyl-D-erythritol 2,4-cyclodiphosphate synthase